MAHYRLRHHQRRLLLLGGGLIFLLSALAILASAKTNPGEGLYQWKPLEARRRLNALDPNLNERCCVRAFDLCVRPPWISKQQFRRRRRYLFRQAKQVCGHRDMRFVFRTRRLTVKKICNYYSSPFPNCAFTSASNQEKYLNQLDRCCGLVPGVCSQPSNLTRVHRAKKQCFLFMRRTADQICGMREEECDPDFWTRTTGQGSPWPSTL